jgi:large subunit ribosomal protein L10
MPNAEKQKLVDEIKGELEASSAVWVVDYRGLTVKQSENLRANIRNAGASVKIYKNSLTERALADLQLPDLGAVLQGPSAFVFVQGDPVPSAKALKQFAKENPLLSIKGGLFEGQLMSDAQVVAVADLPSREELIGEVLSLLDSPLSGALAAIDGGTTICSLLDAAEAKAA